jgi:MtN3 and saliva related transmembrane protein
MSNYIEILGYVAGIFVAVSFMPQVVKSWKTKSTKDIAISLTILNLTGQVLWTLYGIGINSIALIVMSSITLLMTASLLVLKLKYG